MQRNDAIALPKPLKSSYHHNRQLQTADFLSQAAARLRNQEGYMIDRCMIHPFVALAGCPRISARLR